MPESQHYTTAEVAELLRIKPGSVSKMITRGQLPAIKTHKRWLIPRQVVDAMLQPPAAPQGQ
jgi:excisionase family DNA binding protein